MRHRTWPEKGTDIARKKSKFSSKETSRSNKILLEQRAKEKFDPAAQSTNRFLQTLYNKNIRASIFLLKVIREKLAKQRKKKNSHWKKTENTVEGK